jgi:hypothetical protein
MANLQHNHDRKNYDHLVGQRLSGLNMEPLGEIIRIDYEMCQGYHHEEAWAVTDKGKRYNCRRLVG